MSKKIVIAGGSGYLGNLIINYFKKEYEVYILTRSRKNNHGNIHYVEWDGKTLGDWTSVLEKADVIINLAGKNINTKFTEENRKAILGSRIKSTEILGKAIEACKNPPKTWLNASSAAIYKESFEESRDEYNKENGNDFLSIVSKKWEEAFYKYANQQTRKAVFRISIILGDHKGSAYQTLKKLVLLGGGGAAGNGKQMVSWMSEIDFVRALDFIIQNQLEGAFNFCNPNVLSNAELMRQLRKKYQIPFGLPAPEFLIKIGANIIGTAPELVLRSQNVKPKRLIENGFKFHLTEIKDI